MSELNGSSSTHLLHLSWLRLSPDSARDVTVLRATRVRMPPAVFADGESPPVTTCFPIFFLISPPFPVFFNVWPLTTDN